MLYTIININEVLADYGGNGGRRGYLSSNPFDYIRAGYYLDNASLFGGLNNVNYNCNFKRHTSGDRLVNADKRIWTQLDLS